MVDAKIKMKMFGITAERLRQTAGVEKWKRISERIEITKDYEYLYDYLKNPDHAITHIEYSVAKVRNFPDVEFLREDVGFIENIYLIKNKRIILGSLNIRSNIY